MTMDTGGIDEFNAFGGRGDFGEFGDCGEIDEPDGSGEFRKGW
ncbi:hypothetical protein [Streptomyces yaizuensis]|uniref:Uncharacterized protein n=1 Tax=Streptomyces yaizuensis TaxID=2989713 RepID=A0ABQ5NRR5_9ACTN|nr:hypothetical protein [Streptomyces sp. YSPA8]GLF92736.1 hypothetical protein SYYSPA8_00585 [Streptomyces sp. YSPA8]